MKLALVIRIRADSGPAWQRALSYVESATRQGHAVIHCFFQAEAVRMVEDPTLRAPWIAACEQRGIEMTVCSQAAECYQIQVPAPFVIGGLGGVIEAAVNADRVVSFV